MDGSRSRRRSAKVVLSRGTSLKHHDGDHDCRPRPGQECLSGSRDRQTGEVVVRRGSEAGSGDPILQQASPCLIAWRPAARAITGRESWLVLATVRRAVAGEAHEVHNLAAKVIRALAEQAIEVQGRIRQLERDLLAWYRSNDLARRIATVPGVGLLGATAIAATVTDPTQFRSGRQFAAWLGLTPLNNSTGGKERLGRISKMGDQYLRRLLVTGMTSLVRRNKHHPGSADPRINALLARKPPRLVTVAMANRAARAIWAIMVRGEIYRVPALGSAVA